MQLHIAELLHATVRHSMNASAGSSPETDIYNTDVLPHQCFTTHLQDQPCLGSSLGAEPSIFKTSSAQSFILRVPTFRLLISPLHSGTFNLRRRLRFYISPPLFLKGENECVENFSFQVEKQDWKTSKAAYSTHQGLTFIFML